MVVNALKQRINDASGVNVDQEMANLITLQTAYGANARVMSRGARHDRHADEDVRSTWRDRASAALLRCRCRRSSTCAISSTICSASSAPARRPTATPASVSIAA